VAVVNLDTIPVRLQEIENAAVAALHEALEALRELGGDTADRAPDVFALATLLTGGAVRAIPNLRHKEERVAGLLDWSRPNPDIYCEAYEPLVRRRFSVGHELGHFRLHPRPNGANQSCTFVDDEALPSQGMTQEQEADAFAGAFLLPAEALAADLDRFGRCVAFLAERYVVSPATMRRRLRTLEILMRRS